jgi:FkbM family methyltransferase
MLRFITRMACVVTNTGRLFANPYLSFRGKVSAAMTRHWCWTSVQLRPGWVVPLETNEDRATFYDIYFTQSYASIDYRDMTVIDVGAHKGYFALYALLQGARHVVLLECEPRNFRAAEALVRANGLGDRVTLVQKAGHSKIGTITLQISDENWAHSVIAKQDAKSTRSVEVATTTLAEVVSNAVASRGFVVKSNCEGAEVDVFRAVPDAVKEMIISFHAWAPCTRDEFTAHLERHGFDVSVLSGNAEHTNLLCRRRAFAAGKPARIEPAAA